MNMVRSVLSEKQVPKNFWPDLVNWTVHVFNRSPTVVVKDMTAEEAWSGVKPSVDYFRVFGCIGHVHASDSKRKKLDGKNFQCMLLEMSKESKAYRLCDLVSKNIVVSRDVIFEKNKCWNWGTSNEEARLDTLEREDSDIEGSKHDQSEEEYEEEVVAEEEGEVSISFSESSESNSSTSEESTSEVRNKIAPLWMEDYVNGEEFFEVVEHNNSILLTSTTDPTIFEEAVQSSKWRVVMDLEIVTI